MRIADALGVLLVVFAAICFWLGQSALARAEDLPAVYWLLTGLAALRGGVLAVRPARGT